MRSLITNLLSERTNKIVQKFWRSYGQPIATPLRLTATDDSVYFCAALYNKL